MTPGTLYYIVRKDLPWAHRAVQLIHARETYAHYFENNDAAKTFVSTAVVYVVKDEDALRTFLDRVLGEEDWGHKEDQVDAISIAESGWALFFEPDAGHELTAVCTTGGPFDLPLL